jgi:hypothetical protein
MTPVTAAFCVSSKSVNMSLPQNTSVGTTGTSAVAQSDGAKSKSQAPNPREFPISKFGKDVLPHVRVFHAREKLGRAEYVFSAHGAFHFSLGHRPRIPIGHEQALKARFNAWVALNPTQIGAGMNRAFSAKGLMLCDSLGRCPQAEMKTRRWR